MDELRENIDKMKKFKYVLPEKVKYLFLDGKISGVTYGDHYYNRLLSRGLEIEGEITEDEMYDYLANNVKLSRDDFQEVITKEVHFKIEIDKLMEAIENAHKSLDVVGTIITIYSSYRPVIYLKNTDVICEINDYCQTGIHNNLGSYLKNKLQGNEFTWTVADLYHDDLQTVYKFYYYDENYRYNNSSGAGTLTGWLSAEEINKRAKDNTIITLNSNYRLSKRFFDRIKG